MENSINELLMTGKFRTKRGKSPAPGSSRLDSPSYLRAGGYEGDYIPRDRSPARNPSLRDDRSRSRAGASLATDSPSYRRTHQYEIPRSLVPGPHDDRSRSRGRRRTPPPRPTVEDEAVSLARESGSSTPSYDPPLRGIIEQNPIILEAAVDTVEAARLQDIPCRTDSKGSDIDGNGERRFVLIPKSDTYEPNEEDEMVKRRSKDKPRTDGQDRPRPEGPRRETSERPRMERDAPRKEENERQRPGGPRREGSKDATRSRVDKPGTLRHELPSLETKIPREIPPQYRRSASAFTGTTGTPREETPKSQGPRTPSGEYFLSPDMLKPRDHFVAPVLPPRYHQSLKEKGTPVSAQEMHHRAASVSSRPGTGSSEKRTNAGWNVEPRSRRGSDEKLTRSQQLAEEIRKPTRKSSPHSARPSSRRSSRDSAHSSRHYRSSSEDDSASDTERRRRHRHEYRNPEEYDRHGRSRSRSNRSSLDGKRSRLSTPLPSPGISPSQVPRGDEFERAETFPQSTRRRNSRPVSPFSPFSPVDRMTPVEPLRPPSRQSNVMFPSKSLAPPPQTAPYPETLPIPIPTRIDLHSPGDTRRSPIIPQFENLRSASARPSPASHWQPPPFRPASPSRSLDAPMGSYRRFSEDVDSGTAAPLASCPRTTFTRGRNDWLTLPQCPNFDICPSCFNSTIAPTQFRDIFVPSPRRPPEAEVLCDFGASPWYRIAWLLTLKERRRDLKLFYGLTNIAATIQPCRGNHEAIRQWHSIIDPKTGSPIRGFDVCLACVKSVETLLPALRGMFIRTDLHGPTYPHICDMRIDSKRFIQYFDAMETASDNSLSFSEKPDTRSLAALAKRLTLFPECERDKEVVGARWHIISQLPEFTVCEECFDQVVYPEVRKRSALALMFKEGTVSARTLGFELGKGATCQLYSERMREVWRNAVERNDFVGLARRVRERRKIEMGYKKEVNELKRLGGGEREIGRAVEEWKRWE